MEAAAQNACLPGVTLLARCTARYEDGVVGRGPECTALKVTLRGLGVKAHQVVHFGRNSIRHWQPECFVASSKLIG